MQHCVALEIFEVDPVIFVKRRFLQQNSKRGEVSAGGCDMKGGFAGALGGDSGIRTSDEKDFKTFFIRLLKIFDKRYDKISLTCMDA